VTAKDTATEAATAAESTAAPPRQPHAAPAGTWPWVPALVAEGRHDLRNTSDVTTEVGLTEPKQIFGPNNCGWGQDREHGPEG